jgi:Peroxiredoxin
MKTFLSLVLLTFLSTSLFAAGYKVGDKVDNFSLKNVNGKTVSLNDYSKKEGVIVIFTCNHCPYAKAYEQRIIDLDKKYAKQGFPVIAINPNDPTDYPDDSFENMVKRSKEMKYSFPYLFDEQQSVYPVFGATKTPHVYLLKKTKKGFEVAYIGAIDDNTESAEKVNVKYVENAIASIKKGEKVTLAETKAIGCSIKAKKR